jgi:hypothetical protein
MSLVGSIISGVGSLAGGLIGANASKSAASTQSDAAKYSADLQNQQWQKTQQNLQPYMDLGSSYINPLKAALSNPMLTQTFTAPTAAEAQSTPGYQFTLDQGLKSVQNSAAARGLGTSGAALKGAANYSTGLADSTYNDVFNRALQTFNTNYSSASNNVNRLQGVVGTGQNAASGAGALGAQAAANIGNTVTSGANASAAGTVGGANALTSALNGVGNSALTYGLLNNNASNTSNAGTTSGNNQYGFTV